MTHHYLKARSFRYALKYMKQLIFLFI